MPSGPVYERTRTEGDPAEGSHYASGVSNGEDMVKLHFNRNPVTGAYSEDSIAIYYNKI